MSRWLGLATVAEPEWAAIARAFLVLAALIAFLMFLKKRRPALLVYLAVYVGLFLLVGVVTARPDPDVMFRPRHRNTGPTKLRAVLESGSGVYDSDRRGLVALVIPKGRSLETMPIAIREFVLDSDLIVGAVGSTSATAIIARERVAPLETLPPLRVETLLQLAGVDSDELAQSYERTHIFAGRFDNPTHRDWAPIYLSDELKDTEYGSLLNITDQLLKSWSEHGEVRYANFDYPNPPTYPFPTTLLEHSKASTVTFNWNTKGVGYSETSDGYDFVAFTRTGALPVDYLGEKDARLRDAEETAYEYFASSNDPNLARVVQYAGAYQIFRHFGIKASRTQIRSNDVVETEPMVPVAMRMIDRLRTVMFRDIPPDGEASAQLQAALEEFRALQSELQSFHSQYGASGDDDLAHAVVEPRTWQRRLKSAEATEYQRAVVSLAVGLGASPIVKEWISQGRVIVMFMYRSLSGENEQTWIHTPTLVVSWPTGRNAAHVVGGHNISSRITRFVPDAELRAGEVRVADESGGRVIKCGGGRSSHSERRP